MNAFWGTLRKLEHPNYNPETDKFVCAACGEAFDTAKPHAVHVVEKHSREFAYQNIPGKYYDELYQTDRWKTKKELQKQKRTARAALKKAGVQVKVSRAFGTMFFKDGEMKTLTEIQALIPDINVSILLT